MLESYSGLPFLYWSTSYDKGMTPVPSFAVLLLLLQQGVQQC